MCVWTSITQCAERPKKRFTRHWQTGSGRDRASRAARAPTRASGRARGPTSSARPGSTEDVLGPCSCRKRSALVRCANSTVRLQCARPFTTDTLGAAAYLEQSLLRSISPKDHPQPWIQDGLKGDSRAAASPCRLRWPRCRGRGEGGRRGRKREARVYPRPAGRGVPRSPWSDDRFGVMSRKLIAQIQDTVGPCGNDACTYPVRRARDPANRRPSNHAQLRSHALTDS